MFESLGEKLQAIFKNLKRKGKLNEKDVDSVLREVRLALLVGRCEPSRSKGLYKTGKRKSCGTGNMEQPYTRPACNKNS